MIPHIDAILFDLGNTLTATASLAGSLTKLINSPLVRELELDSSQLLSFGTKIEQGIGHLYAGRRLIQPHWLDVWQQASAELGLNLTANDVARLGQAHLKQFVTDCKVEPYTLPLLTALRTKNVRLGLISNATGPVDIFDADLRQKVLAPFFEAVVWSCAVEYRKPDARIFQVALNRLNLKAGKPIVMVGDHEQADILGGKAMGFTTVKVIKSQSATGSSAAEYEVKGAELMTLFQSAL